MSASSHIAILRRVRAKFEPGGECTPSHSAAENAKAVAFFDDAISAIERGQDPLAAIGALSVRASRDHHEPRRSDDADDVEIDPFS